MKKRYLYVSLSALVLLILNRFLIFDLIFTPQQVSLIEPVAGGVLIMIFVFFGILYSNKKCKERPIFNLFCFTIIMCLFQLINLSYGDIRYPEIIGDCVGGLVSYIIYRVVKVEKVESIDVENNLDK